MMKKLKKDSLEFLKITHTIWQLLDYYCKLFKIDPSDDPLELATNCSIRTDGALTYLRYAIPRIDSEPLGMDVLESQDILNDYLRIVLLPNQVDLQPYCNGDQIYNIVEPIYVDSVFYADNFMILDVLYIDNPVAFQHIRTYKIWKIKTATV